MNPTIEYYRECLAGISSISLRFRPKSAEPVLLLRGMSERAAEVSYQEILALREAIDQSQSFKLMYLGVLAAERCINDGDRAWLRASVFAHVLEGFRFDYRENYLRLYATEYAAWRSQLDLSEAIDSFAHLIAPSERACFEAAFDEPHREQSLVMAQLREDRVDGEFRFAAM